MTSIFEDFEAIAVGKLAHLTQIDRKSGEIDWDQKIRQRAFLISFHQLDLKRRDREVAGDRINVDEIDRRASITGAVGRRQKTVGAGPNA